jgi:hypothetical protein
MADHPLLTDVHALRTIFAEVAAFNARLSADLKAAPKKISTPHMALSLAADKAADMSRHMAQAFDANIEINRLFAAQKLFDDISDLIVGDPLPAPDTTPLIISVNVTERLLKMASPVLDRTRLAAHYAAAVDGLRDRRELTPVAAAERRSLFEALKAPVLAGLSPEK